VANEKILLDIAVLKGELKVENVYNKLKKSVESWWCWLRFKEVCLKLRKIAKTSEHVLYSVHPYSEHPKSHMLFVKKIIVIKLAKG
jgi:hypothetical protein